MQKSGSIRGIPRRRHLEVSGGNRTQGHCQRTVGSANSCDGTWIELQCGPATITVSSSSYSAEKQSTRSGRGHCQCGSTVSQLYLLQCPDFFLHFVLYRVPTFTAYNTSLNNLTFFLHSTDSLIQQTIRIKFANCTVLTVAHRLHTIIDSDRVLVMDTGRAIEFDAAHLLLQQPNSIFKGMVNALGPSEVERITRAARDKYDSLQKLS